MVVTKHTAKKHQHHFFWSVTFCVVLLFVSLAIETWTNIDMLVQHYFFDTATGLWKITPQAHQSLKIWFYIGPKIVLILFGVLCFFGLAASFMYPQQERLRHPCMFLILCLIFVPILVAGSKQLTNIYCPKDLTEFGGNRTYQRLLEPIHKDNKEVPRGKGFPAGHSSGGFALMALYFVGNTFWRRILGLTIGFVYGWTMGIYQMLRGEHFFSHTLTSMIAAWLIIYVIAYITGISKNIK